VGIDEAGESAVTAPQKRSCNSRKTLSNPEKRSRGGDRNRRRSSSTSVDALAPDFELSGLLRRGDLRSAGAWLVEHHARDVFVLCRSMLKQRALAEDVTQDVFASAFEKLKGFRLEASARTWLLTIARNRCIDQLRRAGREPVELTEEGDESERTADEAPLPPELLSRRVDVDAALGQLLENERALVVLRFRHGLEYPELAAVFGIKEGTVRMRLSRALGRMREALELRDGAVAAPLPAQSAAPVPAGAMAPPAFGAPPPAAQAPPPPRAVAAPLPAQAPPAQPGIPERPGIFERLRRWIAGDMSVPERTPPDPALARALRPDEPELTRAFRDRLGALVSQLPER
jgi:RNA polymerase sigma-70 factor (ECF subfamily)